jgi:pSer/pThr/pTyr-binding forkhead associated (FHA) protein
MRRRELSFGQGTFLIGRHASCDVVIDSKHVSRRHAKITASLNGVQVLDLGSANGVYLNGERLVEAVPARLQSGDHLLVGGEDIQVFMESPTRPVSDRVPISKPDWVVPFDDLVESERSSPGTRSVDFFDLIGRIVDRALAEGRVEDAHTMLAPQLRNALSDARAGRTLDATARAGAVRYGLALAKAEGGGAWLDFTFDLLTALCWAPDGPLADEVEQTIAAADCIDEARLATYLAALEQTEDRLEALRVMQWARRLRQARANSSR